MESEPNERTKNGGLNGESNATTTDYQIVARDDEVNCRCEIAAEKFAKALMFPQSPFLR
jgi:hypothetical protein